MPPTPAEAARLKKRAFQQKEKEREQAAPRMEVVESQYSTPVGHVTLELPPFDGEDEEDEVEIHLNTKGKAKRQELEKVAGPSTRSEPLVIVHDFNLIYSTRRSRSVEAMEEDTVESIGGNTAITGVSGMQTPSKTPSRKRTINHDVCNGLGLFRVQH